MSAKQALALADPVTVDNGADGALEKIDRDYDAGLAVIGSHDDAFDASQRAMADTNMLTNSQAGPGKDCNLGSDQGLDRLDFPFLHGDRGVSAAHNLRYARGTQDPRATRQVEPREQVAREQGLIDGFDPVGPPAPDFTEGEETLEAARAELVVGAEPIAI